MATRVVRYYRSTALLGRALRVDALFELVCATVCVFAAGTFAAWTGLPVFFFVGVGVALYLSWR
ncbi:MAG: hypothetical protein HC828_15970 [Blastochloris sp.]|nr:hypothetical protein [Blastochloris sp.]